MDVCTRCGTWAAAAAAPATRTAARTSRRARAPRCRPPARPQSGNAVKEAKNIGEVYGGVNWTLALNSSALLPSYLAFSKFFNPVSPTRGDNYTNSLMK